MNYRLLNLFLILNFITGGVQNSLFGAVCVDTLDQKKMGKKLLQAARDGNIKEVKQLLKNPNIDVNYCKVDGFTPLIYAAQNGHLPIVSKLIKSNANVLWRSTNGTIALNIAAAKGHAHIVDYLIENLKNNGTLEKAINIYSKGYPPLLIAVKNQHYEVTEKLVKAGANIILKGPDNLTAFQVAYNDTPKSKITELLQNALNEQYEERGIPLFNFAQLNTNIVNLQDFIESVQTNNAKQVQKHISRGTNVNTPYRCNIKTGNKAPGLTILFSAAQFGNNTIVQHLLDAKAHVDHKGPLGITALMIAAHNGYTPIVQQLLAVKADMYATTIESTSAPLLAAEEGHINPIKEFLNAGFDINNQNNPRQKTMLFTAAENGHLSLVTCLLEEKADVNISDIYGSTPLIVAANNGHQKVVEILLDHGALINTQNNTGITALSNAVLCNHPDTVNFLLTRGADKTLGIFNSPITPWTAALIINSSTIAKCVFNHGVSEKELCQGYELVKYYDSKKTDKEKYAIVAATIENSCNISYKKLKQLLWNYIITSPTTIASYHADFTPACFNQKCSTEQSLQKCNTCKTALYCSPECQQRDWPTHKLYCKQYHGYQKKMTAAAAPLVDSSTPENLSAELSQAQPTPEPDALLIAERARQKQEREEQERKRQEEEQKRKEEDIKRKEQEALHKSTKLIKALDTFVPGNKKTYASFREVYEKEGCTTLCAVHQENYQQHLNRAVELLYHPHSQPKIREYATSTHVAPTKTASHKHNTAKNHQQRSLQTPRSTATKQTPTAAKLSNMRHGIQPSIRGLMPPHNSDESYYLCSPLSSEAPSAVSGSNINSNNVDLVIMLLLAGASCEERENPARDDHKDDREDNSMSNQNGHEGKENEHVDIKDVGVNPVSKKYVPIIYGNEKLMLDIEHIFTGEAGNRGLHHCHNDKQAQNQDRNPCNPFLLEQNGCYAFEIENNGETKYKSFFPAYWKLKEAKFRIMHALQNNITFFNTNKKGSRIVYGFIEESEHGKPFFNPIYFRAILKKNTTIVRTIYPITKDEYDTRYALWCSNNSPETKHAGHVNAVANENDQTIKDDIPTVQKTN